MITRTQIIKFSAVGLIALSIVCVGVSKLLTNRVNAYVLNLAEKITEQIGNPVTIDRVTIKWDWLLLKVNVKNLTILDKQKDIPLFIVSEIISTVDALDSLRSFSLKFKHLLLRNPRCVFEWDGADFTKDQIDPRGIFKLLAMQRHVVIENGDLHLQGKGGSDLPFMGLWLDLRQIADAEYQIIARGTLAASVQPEFAIGIKYYGELENYDKAIMDFEIKTSNIELAELFNFIPKYHQELIKGDFSDFDVKGTIQNSRIRNISSDFAITKILIDKHNEIRGGNGHVAYKPGENKYNVQLSHLTLHNDELFTQPINIDAINVELEYAENTDNTWSLSASNARVKLMEVELHPSLNVFVDNNQVKEINIDCTLENAGVRSMLVVMPDKKFTAGLNDWLRKALVEGTIEKFQLKYVPKNLAWNLNFKNTELKFANDWPSITNIDASLIMQNNKIDIVATRAQILNVPVNNLRMAYKDTIVVNGSLATSLDKTIEYFMQTPLHEDVGGKIAALTPKGDINLDLQLNIDLAKAQPVTVKGVLQLNQAMIQVPDVTLNLTEINGTVNFANNGFNADKLSFNCLGQPALAKITTIGRKDSVLNIDIDTQLSIPELQKRWPNVIFAHADGVTKVKATLELPWSGDKAYKSLTLRSDLIGINIALPAPFNKSANNKLPLVIQYHFSRRNEDSSRFKLGEILDGILYLKNRKLTGGRIAINKKLDSLTETDNLLIAGNLQKVNWATWEPLLNTKQKQESLPIELDLNIHNLTILDEEYPNTRIKYLSQKNEVSFANQIAAGSVILSKDEDKIDIKLDRLTLPEKSSKSTTLLENIRNKKASNQLPLLQFYCEKLSFKKHTFKNVALELLPRPYGYEITNFSIANDNILVQGQGNWQMDNDALTSIAGNAYTQNFGKVLAECGYANSMTRGNGEINFTMQWNGAPTDFNLLNLTGNAHLDLRSGSLTNVNPGLGRIIGLLSLESIQRRLQLDFSDLLSKGFAFDKFIADLKFKPGNVSTDNVLINSPAAKIELAGKTGLKDQDLDCTMFVTPKVGASLPIAAAIAAGNPAVGAAIWLFDKASGSKISEITKYKYKVSGTWEKPQIDEVSNKDKVVG